MDCRDFGWVGFDPVRRDAVAEKINFCGAKFTFAGIQQQTVIFQPLEECAEVRAMFFCRRTGYEDVVQVNKNKRKVFAHHVHQPLKSLGRVFESKRRT